MQPSNFDKINQKEKQRQSKLSHLENYLVSDFLHSLAKTFFIVKSLDAHILEAKTSMYKVYFFPSFICIKRVEKSMKIITCGKRLILAERTRHVSFTSHFCSCYFNVQKFRIPHQLVVTLIGNKFYKNYSSIESTNFYFTNKDN